MKLSKKDIIMLAVLGVIIFVAVFYVYGVMPTNEKATELDGKISTKKAEVADMQNRWNTLLAQQKDKDIKKLLDFHYDSKTEGNMPTVLDQIALEKKMTRFLNAYGIKGYATSNWSISENAYTNSYDDVVVGNSFYVARLALAFQMKTEEDFRHFVDVMKDRTDFRLIDYSIHKNDEKKEGEPTPTPDPDAKPEEHYEISGSMNIEYFMGEKYESLSDELYKVMEDKITNIHSKDGEVDTVVFDRLDLAKYQKEEYRAYAVTLDSSKNKVFTKIPYDAYTKTIKEKTVEFKFNGLESDTDVAIMAIGGINEEKRYYKTKLDNDTETIKVLTYGEANPIANIKRIDGTYNEISFDNIVNADYKDIKYIITNIITSEDGTVTYEDIDPSLYTMTISGNKTNVVFKNEIKADTMVTVVAKFKYQDRYYMSKIDPQGVIAISPTLKGVDVTNLVSSVDTITFDAVAGAVKYQVYTFTQDAQGKRTYVAQDPKTYVVSDKDGKASIKFLNIAGGTDVVVEVTSRDREGKYYITELTDTTPSIKASSIATIEYVSGVTLGATPNTIVINKPDAKYKDVKYTYYSVKVDPEGNMTFVELVDVATTIKDNGATIDVTFTDLTAGTYNIAVQIFAHDDSMNYYVSENGTATKFVELTIA